MPDEAVLDASIVAAVLFNEPLALRVRLAIESRFLSAPDFLLVELASVGSKKRRKGEPVSMSGLEIIASARELVDRFEASSDLAPHAFEIAAATRISLYDALYLVMARGRGARVLTLDERLGRAAEEAGLGDLVEMLVV